MSLLLFITHMLRHLLTLGTLLAACHSMQAAMITLDASGRGWINEDAVANGEGPANNYFAGVNFGPTDEFRNFFLFDIPAFDGTVSSARLLIHTGGFDTDVVSEIYQVSSIPAALPLPISETVPSTEAESTLPPMNR